MNCHGDFISKGVFFGLIFDISADLCAACDVHLFSGVAHLAVRKAGPANNTVLYFANFRDDANERRVLLLRV